MSIYVKSGSALTYLQNVFERQMTSYQKSMDQFSSGKKYSSVGDNPIAVCESAKLDVKISANTQAASNVKFGGEMLHMAEDSQTNIISNLGRIRDLCVQIANGTYTASEKDGLLQEVRTRLNYIDNTATSTNFNGVKLLDGSGNASSLFLQVGPSSDAVMNVGEALIDVSSAALGINLPAAINGSNWTDTQIQNYISSVDAATSTLLGTTAKLGGYLNRLDFISSTLTSMNNNLTENKSIISDADAAETSADLVKYQIQQEASMSILTQANQIPALALELLNHK